MKYLTETIHDYDRSYVCEFIRNEDGTKTINKITTFYPYFYVDETAPINGWDGVMGVQTGFVSILKTPVKRVSVRSTFLIKEFKDKIEKLGYKTWEADISFHNRYEIDQPEIQKGRLKVMWLDIETDMLDNVPNIELADEEIVCITTKCDGIRKTWLFTDKEFSFQDTTVFKTEVEMLEDFISYIRVESPDILSAYNIDNFDLKYIIHRCNNLGINYNVLSSINKIDKKTVTNINRKTGAKKENIIYKVRGTVIFDMLTGYKLWRKYGNMGQLMSYSLNYVARTVLNQEKIDHGKKIGELWRNDLKTLVEYNQWDVELIEMIDKRCKVIDFFDNVRRKSHIQFDDIYRTTAIVDGYLIHRLNKRVILPSVTKHDREKFEGAYVRESTPGIFRNIIVCDIAGMYPSIIKSFNVSYETVGGNEIVMPSGITFSKEPGVIPMFMDELALERKEYKKKMELAEKAGNQAEYEMWYQRQYGTKIIMNAIYGYCGCSGARLYRKDVAQAVTNMGEHLIKKINDWVESKGNKILYNDTDSTYIFSKYTSPFSIVAEGMDLQAFINESIDNYVKGISGKNFIKTEFESAIKIMLFTSAKKRYAYKLLWDGTNGFKVSTEMKLKGFDGKRSDSCELAKKVQKHVLDMILDGHTEEEVQTYLKDIDKKLRRRFFNDEDIGFPKGISKAFEEYDPPGPIIKGSIFSNMRYGTNFGPGDKPKYVWIKSIIGCPSPRIVFKKTFYKIDAIVFDKTIPKDIIIDWTRMSDSILKNKLETIYESIGWKWKDLNVTSLNNYIKQP